MPNVNQMLVARPVLSSAQLNIVESFATLDVPSVVELENNTMMNVASVGHIHMTESSDVEYKKMPFWGTEHIIVNGENWSDHPNAHIAFKHGLLPQKMPIVASIGGVQTALFLPHVRTKVVDHMWDLCPIPMSDGIELNVNLGAIHPRPQTGQFGEYLDNIIDICESGAEWMIHTDRPPWIRASFPFLQDNAGNMIFRIGKYGSPDDSPPAYEAWIAHPEFPQTCGWALNPVVGPMSNPEFNGHPLFEQIQRIQGLSSQRPPTPVPFNAHRLGSPPMGLVRIPSGPIDTLDGII